MNNDPFGLGQSYSYLFISNILYNNIFQFVYLLEVANPARARSPRGPGLGPEYVGPGRASGLDTSGRKVLIASGLVGPGLPCAFEFRLINNITI